MRLTAVALAAFAAFGNNPVIAWMPAAAARVPESMWLAMWGVALIGVSSTLRARFRPRPVQEEKTESAPALNAIGATLAGRTA